MSNFRKHFRKGNKFNNKHPTYIFDEEGKNYDYLSITHSPKTKGTKNLPLSKNPNPSDSDDSYIRPRCLKSKKSSFGEKLVGWKFDPQDKKKIDNIVNPPKKHK